VNQKSEKTGQKNVSNLNVSVVNNSKIEKTEKKKV